MAYVFTPSAAREAAFEERHATMSAMEGSLFLENDALRAQVVHLEAKVAMLEQQVVKLQQDKLQIGLKGKGKGRG